MSDNQSLTERPNVDEYYLAMAFVIAQRSFDPSTKCGCVLVSKNSRVLSTGYNGPIKGSNDKEIPLTRPEKYYHFIHSEENALLAYCGSDQDIQGATCYITGHPCHRCLRMLLQKGIARIVFVATTNAKCLDDQDLAAQKIMLTGRNIDIKKVSPSIVEDLLAKTLQNLKEQQEEKK